jgi:hypothetical protein
MSGPAFDFPRNTAGLQHNHHASLALGRTTSRPTPSRSPQWPFSGDNCLERHLTDQPLKNVCKCSTVSLALVFVVQICLEGTDGLTKCSLFQETVSLVGLIPYVGCGFADKVFGFAKFFITPLSASLPRLAAGMAGLKLVEIVAPKSDHSLTPYYIYRSHKNQNWSHKFDNGKLFSASFRIGETS